MDRTVRGYRQIPIYLRYLINTVLLAAFLLLGNALLSSGAVNRAQSAVILQIGIYALLAVSLNVATGYLGQLPLGHAGFMAVGAYAAALLWKAMPRNPGAILLGLKAPVLIGHGDTSVDAVKNGTLATASAVRAQLVDKVAQAIFDETL